MEVRVGAEQVDGFFLTLWLSVFFSSLGAACGAGTVELPRRPVTLRPKLQLAARPRPLLALATSFSSIRSSSWNFKN
jgi:hypothetical protein